MYAPAGAHTNYAMVRAGYECGSADKSLGHYTTVRKCADKCASSSQCRFLKYNGATGDCVHEKADSSQCSKTNTHHSGRSTVYVGGTDWKAAPGYDFYEFRGESCFCASMTVLTPTGPTLRVFEPILSLNSRK